MLDCDCGKGRDSQIKAFKLIKIGLYSKKIIHWILNSFNLIKILQVKKLYIDLAKYI